MQTILSHENWGYNWGKKLRIVGPCGAESEEQLHHTIKLLDSDQYDIIRAGIWKPRTKPGMFEGVGTIGLGWLKDSALQVHKHCMTEVANTEHVDAALKAGIDMVWIGARTTVNPFQVQEIAQALKGVDIPVFVKNPIHADLELWIGAIERFLWIGTKRVAAVHRGFYMYKKEHYRNPPMWSIPLELKRRYPTLSVITDPSHIGGQRELIQPLAQEAYDLDFDGLMIESHYSPDTALSDAMQQITPQEYNNLMRSLLIKEDHTDDTEINIAIEQLREKIDETDSKLMDALRHRLDLVKEIAELKQKSNLSVYQNDRWNNILVQRLQTAQKMGLDEKMIRNIWDLIHQESLRIHQEIKLNTHE